MDEADLKGNVLPGNGRPGSGTLGHGQGHGARIPRPGDRARIPPSWLPRKAPLITASRPREGRYEAGGDARMSVLRGRRPHLAAPRAALAWSGPVRVVLAQ